VVSLAGSWCASPASSEFAHAWEKAMNAPRLMPRIQLPGPAKPEQSLKLLAETGATPKQMLWGLWWCHTLPALFKSVATVACAALATRLAGRLFG
jgi:hypothetical protein